MRERNIQARDLSELYMSEFRKLKGKVSIRLQKLIANVAVEINSFISTRQPRRHLCTRVIPDSSLLPIYWLEIFVCQGVITLTAKMAPKMTKNQMRRAKKKEQKKAQVFLLHIITQITKILIVSQVE